MQIRIQGALSKERREQKMQERQAETSDAPTSDIKTWNDPMPSDQREYQVKSPSSVLK